MTMILILNNSYLSVDLKNVEKWVKEREKRELKSRFLTTLPCFRLNRLALRIGLYWLKQSRDKMDENG